MGTTLVRWLLVACVVGAGACEGPSDTPPDSSGTDGTDSTDDTDIHEIIGDPEVLRLAPPEAVNGDYAATSLVCADCHSNSSRATALRDAAGRGVAPYDLWRGSMMAHSSRDPIYRAAVAAEMHHVPSLADTISKTCTTCHAPVAWAEHTLGGEPAPGQDVIQDAGDRGDMARDGASCVGCHLQTDDADGGTDTWSSQLQYNDQREIYGPHRAPESGPMRNHIGFTPVERPGMRSSETCVSCHTLQTTPVDGDGNLLRTKFSEQMPYVEYRSSDFFPERGTVDSQSCQNCHMPFTDIDGNYIDTRIARTPGGGDFPWLADRTPFARHLLVGGNAFTLELIRDHRELLGSPATEEALDVNIALTRAFLDTSADLDLSGWDQQEGQLLLPVKVLNQAGHKLPTGYPARRAWLHVVVRDAGDLVVFESGGVDAAGRLVGADGQPLASELADGPIEPHRTRIEAPSDVVVYQSWMQNDEGEPTTALLRGVRYAKDNRLLPRGWAPSGSDEPLVGAVGVDGDGDFVGGGDTVDVVATLSGKAPWTVEVSLQYQPFSPRYLEELVRVETPETKALGVLLDGRPVPVETLAQASVVVRGE